MQRPIQLLLVGVVMSLFAMQVIVTFAFRSEQNNALTSGVDTGMLLDINVAEARELSLMPSVGPVLAQRIIADRNQNGRFETVADLSRVHGIGDKTLEQIGRFCIVNQPDGPSATSESTMLAASEK
ncbi:MAG: helix-hairpin-helix domain-containing protein [Pirellulaceae bacterium]